MNDCAKCGNPVRLGAFRLTIERRPGVVNYITHSKMTECDGTDGWECHKFKSDKSEPRPSQVMMERWDSENPGEGS